MLQSMGSQRVGHDLETEQQQRTCVCVCVCVYVTTKTLYTYRQTRGLKIPTSNHLSLRMESGVRPALPGSLGLPGIPGLWP